jgi:hypothetical protein
MKLHIIFCLRLQGKRLSHLYISSSIDSHYTKGFRRNINFRTLDVFVIFNNIK